MSTHPSCPQCGETVTASGPQESNAFPFCSSRCKMADLGKWFAEDYRISRPTHELDDEISEQGD